MESIIFVGWGGEVNQDPAWFIDFDYNPEVPIATWKKVFAELAATPERVFGFNLPWPGLGVVNPQRQPQRLPVGGLVASLGFLRGGKGKNVTMKHLTPKDT